MFKLRLSPALMALPFALVTLSAGSAWAVCGAGTDFEGLNPQKLYLDADDDGWGKPGAYVLSCNELPGRSLNNTDCDDTDDLVHPGQGENLSTPYDDNCNGSTSY